MEKDKKQGKKYRKKKKSNRIKKTSTGMTSLKLTLSKSKKEQRLRRQEKLILQTKRKKNNKPDFSQECRKKCKQKGKIHES